MKKALGILGLGAIALGILFGLPGLMNQPVPEDSGRVLNAASLIPVELRTITHGWIEPREQRVFLSVVPWISWVSRVFRRKS